MEKKLAEKREHARFRLMSSSCVTSLSFSGFFFFSVSLPLSRFNKASCRAWPSWETQQSVAGAEAELGWVVAAGVQVGGWELPTIFPMQHSTQSGALARSRLFSPLRLLSFHPSINFLSILLFLLTTPASVSFPPHDFQHPPPLFSSFSYSSSCCPPFHGGGCGKLTLSLFNDAFQTSAQWHHNKSRTSLWVISPSKDNDKWPSASRRLLRDTTSGPDLFPSFDRSLTRARAVQPGWDRDMCVCVCVCIRLCVSAGIV